MSNIKLCTPLKCSTFANIATRPTRSIKKGETLPPPTIEQVTTVDSIVTNCPYRQGKECTNTKEDFKQRRY